MVQRREIAARFGLCSEIERCAQGAIALGLLHQALIAADGAPTPPRAGIVLAGGLDADLAAAAAVRAAGVTVVALAQGSADPEAVAAADGWRWVARRMGGGFSVIDRLSGLTRECARLEDVVAWPD